MSRKPKPAASGGDEPNFEDALERLETIVDDLESGNLSLDESIARYEEGTKLSRLLTRKLDEAEKKIERLTEARDDAQPTTEPVDLDLEKEDEPAPKRPARSEELPF